MKKQIVLTAVIIGLIAIAMSAAVYAETVTIGYPSSGTDLGISSSGGLTNAYWIGQFPVTINGKIGEVYCLNPDGDVYIGQPYSAIEQPISAITDPNDPLYPLNVHQQAISYILGWYAPTDNNGGAIDQVAVWMLLNQNYGVFTIASPILNGATTLANYVTGLSAPQLEWITPSTGTPGNQISTYDTAGATVTFTVQLADSSGHAIHALSYTDSDNNAHVVPLNAKVDFIGTITAPGSKTPTPLFSQTGCTVDSNGQAQITVAVPKNAQYNAEIQVTASVQCVEPVAYLDLRSISDQGSTQNLIAAGTTFDLTASYNIYVTASLFVLPESAYGALSAVVAFAAAFLIYAKIKRPAKLANQ